ncbi:hypothetical protein SDRG_07005 [Saprolegnia diclina VS20]|uniref:Myb-like domain-containing protein n=1 Tax=Saprolegnia diclina (strain VS20) TaxID=1156394 RepID=T0RZC2_SAPDV|nr:hypothetical protein SDRG_07005 [Saprolegnia diclina VS20]EQC35727.1 hypothetical protein SDRG_07005 [Saprolegnia diclina VS20]|eukprot:XP_008611044.1 hypothetical protein SDRG_07005 [Saprolegnia diclina VS20]
MHTMPMTAAYFCGNRHKGSWSALEDMQLNIAMVTMPRAPWRRVAQCVPTRSTTQVRIRGLRLERLAGLPPRPRLQTSFKESDTTVDMALPDSLVPHTPWSDDEAQDLVSTFTPAQWKIVTAWPPVKLLDGTLEEKDVNDGSINHGIPPDEPWLLQSSELDELWEALLELEVEDHVLVKIEPIEV